MCQTCCDNHFAAIHELLAQNNQLLRELRSKDSLLEQLLTRLLPSSVSPETIVPPAGKESNSGSSSCATDFSPESSTKKQGRRERSLFLQPAIAEQEKQRLLAFLHQHKLGSNDFDASEENSCNQIAICFFRQWAKRNLLNAGVGGTALVRFLKTDCELSITVEEKTLGNAFSRMINGGQSYPDWFGSVSEHFQN